MNGAQLHLLINHAPLFFPLIGGLVLIVGLVWRSQDVKKVALWILVLGALLTLPTYFSGEPAEHVVKNYPLIDRNTIEDHEKSALLSLLGVEVLGVFSIAGLILLKKRSLSDGIFMVVVCLCLLAVFWVARTSHLGGLIRHEEIKQGQFN